MAPAQARPRPASPGRRTGSARRRTGCRRRRRPRRRSGRTGWGCRRGCRSLLWLAAAVATVPGGARSGAPRARPLPAGAVARAARHGEEQRQWACRACALPKSVSICPPAARRRPADPPTEGRSRSPAHQPKPTAHARERASERTSGRVGQSPAGSGGSAGESIDRILHPCLSRRRRAPAAGAAARARPGSAPSLPSVRPPRSSQAVSQPGGCWLDCPARAAGCGLPRRPPRPPRRARLNSASAARLGNGAPLLASLNTPLARPAVRRRSARSLGRI